MYIHLVLAVFWVFVAVSMLFYHHGINPANPFRFGNVSAGWLALLLASYNLMRWWFASRSRGAEQPDPEELLARKRERAGYSTIKPPEHNSAFDFSEEPKPKKDGDAVP